jgi:hypothetical protein
MESLFVNLNPLSFILDLCTIDLNVSTVTRLWACLPGNLGSIRKSAGIFSFSTVSIPALGSTQSSLL